MIAQLISDMATSGIFLHASYVFLIFFLLFDKRKQYLILEQSLEKNIKLGDKLDDMRYEIISLHNELLQFTQVNCKLQSEIKLLTEQVDELRELVKTERLTGIYPESLNVFSTGGSIKLQIIDDATITGDTWAITGQGHAEGDIAATAVSGGEKFKTFYLAPGVNNIDLSEFYEFNDEGYHRLADDSDSYTFTVVASKLDGTTVTALATLNYKELA